MENYKNKYLKYKYKYIILKQKQSFYFLGGLDLHIIHIIGSTGSGKTTLGKLLSKHKNVIIIDTDDIDDKNALKIIEDHKYNEFFFDDNMDKYFKMLNAEYKRGIRRGNRVEYEYYCPHGKRNEALDCRVYNIAAREVLYYQIINETLEEDIEAYKEKVRRKLLVSEKVEFFYGYMEKTAFFN